MNIFIWQTSTLPNHEYFSTAVIMSEFHPTDCQSIKSLPFPGEGLNVEPESDLQLGQNNILIILVEINILVVFQLASNIISIEVIVSQLNARCK